MQTETTRLVDMSILWELHVDEEAWEIRTWPTAQGIKGIYCPHLPYHWPYWGGGNKSFMEEGQPFGKLYELREATMLEF